MKAMKSGSLLLLGLLATGTGSIGADAHRSNLDLVRQLNEAFVEVAEKVTPSVVVINVVEKPPAKTDNSKEENSPPDSIPRDLWRYFHRHLEPAPEGSLGQGSGVIIRENGYILTNRHVVEDAESIEVRLQDGRRFKATVRGVDPQSDVAVIKIDAKGLPVAKLADSAKTRVGEFAIAIGAPFSLDYSVTYGHVSAKGRSNVILPFEGGAMMDQEFIQTDASINPGNSGGPLVNIEGEVIGINTLIRGLRTGIGFAVPSNLAREVSDQLVAEGKFTRSWLGIEIRALRDDPELKAAAKDLENGVVVRGIRPEGPAAKSDLKAYDIITAVDGQRVGTPQELRGEIRHKKVGQPVLLDVSRAGSSLQVRVSPGEWVDPMTLASSRGAAEPEGVADKLGVTVHPLTRELAKQFGVEKTEGVVVLAVEKGTPAAKKGLKPGDVIASVNQQPVADPKQFQEALAKADLKKGVRLKVVNGSAARFVTLKEGE